MADAQDRVLAQVAVEAGLLTREEAAAYWQRVQAPGAPRLVPLLIQEQRLTPAQLEQLKARYYATQSGSGSSPGLSGSSGSVPALGQPAPPAPPPPKRAATSAAVRTAMDAPASETFLEAGAGAYSQATQLEEGGTAATFIDGPERDGGGDPEGWEEALHKDMLLARVLLQRGAVGQAQLRECRDLQLQHRLRLGVVLVRKGYLDRGRVEEAIQEVRGLLDESPPDREFYHAASTQLDGLSPHVGSRGMALEDQPTFVSGRGSAEQDAADTVLNTPQGGLPSVDPFQPAPSMGLSVEELNPFADVPLKSPSGRVPAPAAASPGPTRSRPAAGHPPAAPLPSVDELGVFEDVPLPPPPGMGPVDLPPAGLGPSRTSGFTPTGIPIGGEADSGSTKMKARDRAELQRVQVKQRPRGSGASFPLLLLLMIACGLGLAVGLYFLIAHLDF